MRSTALLLLAITCSLLEDTRADEGAVAESPAAGAQASDAQKADVNATWRSLVDESRRKKAAFQIGKYDANLPSVLIYGDSISIGYQPMVKKMLKGKANVYRIQTNGGDSSTIVPKTEQMLSTMAPFAETGEWPKKWDVIHLNVGLHDLKYAKDGKLVKEGGTQVHTLEQYQQNLRGALDYLKTTAPEATIMFATTTPVPKKSGGRRAGDAVKYNEAAMEVLRDYPEVVVNDLYAFTRPNQSKWWTRPGNVHFNSKGRQAQGKEVARAVLEVLGEQE